MDKIKEEFGNNPVKDIEFSLNTSQSGEASYITKTIKGDLDAVIISTETSIQIKIVLEEFENIVLFEIADFVGSKYLPLRLGALASSAENFRDSPEKWVLNDKLRFKIKGPLNTIVNFIVRYR